MKYEVILFDADETLFDFKKSEKQAFENSIREFNMDYDENYHLKVYEEINKIFINSNSFYYFKTTLTSMFAKCECINDLNRYSQKRNIFIKLFIYLILHHHFHIAYYMKKIYYLIRNEQVNG